MIKLFKMNYPNYLNNNVDAMDKIYFNIATFVLFSKLTEKGIKEIKIKIPYKALIYSEGGYNVIKLKKFFEDESTKIMDNFDKRNGNNIV